MRLSAGLLALALGFTSASADTFKFLYIEANEGTASGGHTALQFDDEVYHYQYTGGLTRLAKEYSADFRFDYRYLQNRTIHVADIEASKQTLDLLQDHFKRQYWDQDRQFKRLQALKNDRLLLEWLLNQADSLHPVAADPALQLPAAGLFYSASDFADVKKPAGNCRTHAAAGAILAVLQQQLLQQYGADFLQHRSLTLEQAILKLPAPTSDESRLPSHYSFSQHYSDLLTGLLAVRVLQETRPLTVDACQVLVDPQWQLDDDKKQALKTFQQHLLKTAQALLSSKRPDWGQALLVTLARLIVVEQSLQSGLWVFLNDFNPDADVISTATYSRQADEMRIQRQAAEQSWRQNWQTLITSKALNDLSYVDLELTANRYHEWQASQTSNSLRYHGQQLMPVKSLDLPHWIVPDLSKAQLVVALQAMQNTIPLQAAVLEEDYAYDLFSRNCATEIFRNINLALANETEQRLGGRIDPDISFVPFVAFESVQNHYAVSDTQVLLSFRQQALLNQYQHAFIPWMYARESNVFSAELYSYNPDDAAFMFFTDDGVLLRPLFGAFNTLTGIGQSLLGLIRLPIDDGITLSKGTRGLMMSLPELAFINIRKGSYKFAHQAIGDQ
ncbi:hypothetical protein [Methylomonas lenta]|uniref:hypothetical protein n=1 Tax=Methylomonas lenta TaxID=980561 RepID=UPI000AF8FD49|nr:hypothetical protein [Methylomonas lenta]